MSDEVQLGTGFNASGFACNLQVAGGGGQLNQADVTTAGSDGAVDDHIVNTMNANFAAMD